MAQDGVLISFSSVPTVRFSWGKGERLGGSRLILVAGSKCPVTILWPVALSSCCLYSVGWRGRRIWLIHLSDSCDSLKKKNF